MFLFISTMCSFHYNTKDKSQKWKTKVELQYKRFLLKVEINFNPSKGSCTHQEVLGEDALRETRRKKKLSKSKERSSAQEI